MEKLCYSAIKNIVNSKVAIEDVKLEKLLTVYNFPVCHSESLALKFPLVSGQGELSSCTNDAYDSPSLFSSLLLPEKGW